MKKLILSSVVILFASSATAQAMEADYFYDGMRSENTKVAYPIAKRYPSSATKMEPISNGYSKYKGIGRVSNKNGWAGPKYEAMGTGFVVDDYTFLTNAHVIDDEHGKATEPKFVTFELNRNGDDIPYRFKVKDIVKIPYSDVAVVHTKSRLTRYAKPLTLATDYQISQLKQGQRMYSVGYPYDGQGYERRYFNRAVFIMRSSNQTEFIMKDTFRAGASGSPLMDTKNRVHGLRTYSYNLYGNSKTNLAKVEYSGAESLYGYTGREVLRNMY
ncbi:trypsin-like serine peptidase [Macrococcus animalis]|uniref:trypsin-like serine peptidase n=1 Tax=Macrococcus animalis TaxID=3395467 RepID=UPI0039BEA6C6